MTIMTPKLQELMDAVPDDPSQVIPNKHLRPIWVELERVAARADQPTDKDSNMEEKDEVAPVEGGDMEAEEKPEGMEEGKPEGGSSKASDEQKAKLAELTQLDIGMIDEFIEKALVAMKDMGQEPSIDALIVLLESDPQMAANMGPAMGMRSDGGGTVF
jgi:hypothetical protein